MAKNNDKKKFIKKLRNKYRLVIMNDSSFEEIFTFKLSRLNVFSMVGLVSIILLSLGILLIALTPLREFLPNYPDGTMRRNIQMNALMIDSLENELQIRDQFLSNLKNITNGRETQMHELIQDTDIQIDDSSESENYDDSMFMSQFDEEDYFISNLDYSRSQEDISRTFLYVPVTGIITNQFNSAEKHYGIDIVAPAEEPILASLKGTVIMATWTLETGNVIQIQHENDLISVYKHNSMLLKKSGDFVKAGEPIAIIGNSGEYSSGPHLHFELWHKGIPINPEEYIKF